jgi:DNA phosphorothioation-dependent restriction protein DptG
MDHTFNPSYLGSWDQEDHGSRPAWANSSWDSISKITRAKWTEGLAQVVEYLFSKHEAMSLNHKNLKKKKELWFRIGRVAQILENLLTSLRLWVQTPVSNAHAHTHTHTHPLVQY